MVSRKFQITKTMNGWVNQMSGRPYPRNSTPVPTIRGLHIKLWDTIRRTEWKHNTNTKIYIIFNTFNSLSMACILNSESTEWEPKKYFWYFASTVQLSLPLRTNVMSDSRTDSLRSKCKILYQSTAYASAQHKFLVQVSVRGEQHIWLFRLFPT